MKASLQKYKSSSCPVINKHKNQSIKPKKKSQIDAIPDLEIETRQSNKRIGYLWNELQIGTHKTYPQVLTHKQDRIYANHEL